MSNIHSIQCMHMCVIHVHVSGLLHVHQYLSNDVFSGCQSYFDGSLSDQHQEILDSLLHGWTDVLLQLRVLLQQGDLEGEGKRGREGVEGERER